jgi:hypothetical protein
MKHGEEREYFGSSFVLAGVDELVDVAVDSAVVVEDNRHNKEPGYCN